MSRICIKGLPKHLDDEGLRKQFADAGFVVTDAKVVKRPDGYSRCFGFVGFKRERDATKAIKHFNGTYVDTSKVIVESAKPVRFASIIIIIIIIDDTSS